MVNWNQVHLVLIGIEQFQINKISLHFYRNKLTKKCLKHITQNTFPNCGSVLKAFSNTISVHLKTYYVKEVLPLSKLRKPDFWMYEYQINKVFVFLIFWHRFSHSKYLFYYGIGRLHGFESMAFQNKCCNLHHCLMEETMKILIIVLIIWVAWRGGGDCSFMVSTT